MLSDDEDTSNNGNIGLNRNSKFAWFNSRPLDSGTFEMSLSYSPAIPSKVTSEEAKNKVVSESEGRAPAPEALVAVS